MKPLEIWLHPQQTARRFAELQNDLAEVRQEGIRAGEQAEAELARLRQEVAEARGETAKYKERLEETARKYERLKEQTLMENRRRDSLFADHRCDMEELKAGYERRLEHLRHALADAHALLADRNDYDDLRQMTIVDMTAPREGPPQQKGDNVAQTPGAEKAGTSAGADDWLEPLPD